jgi:hypothetical protein
MPSVKLYKSQKEQKQNNSKIKTKVKIWLGPWGYQIGATTNGEGWIT